MGYSAGYSTRLTRLRPPGTVPTKDSVGVTGERWGDVAAVAVTTVTASPDSRERLLAVAERLFGERGYTAVTLRDIAAAVGIRQASLYHHMPGGKEQLFVEVTERGLERVRRELEQALAAAPDGLRARLRVASGVLLAQPPIDLARMVRSDMPAIAPEHARRLTALAFASLVLPLEGLFAAAQASGESRPADPRLLAGVFLAMLETVQVAEHFSGASPGAMASALIDVLIDGLRASDG